MKTLNVAFLWHLHQPFYVDPQSGRLILPWVRLHAIKGYNDMAATVDEIERVRATFNIVPSLLLQLELYARRQADDVFLQYSERRPEDMTADEKAFILKNFFMCYFDTMVAPYPRYAQLLARRGPSVIVEDVDTLLSKFSDDDLRDLQVWFNLTWFGFQAEKRHPLISALKRKGRDFKEDEKAELLDLQIRVIRDVIPMYRRLSDEGRLELTTSPAYHPILPLLVDTDSALRSLPGRPMPLPAFRAPEDARGQILLGIRQHERFFGRRPTGMWPPEGSVSPEAVELAREAGLSWMASDEGILLRTLNTDRRWDVLYKPYFVGQGDPPIALVFRDRTLSDLIGFTYPRNPAQDAVADFVRRLAAIRDHLRNVPGEALVSVILDGENPWEYYKDGGREFLETLYTRLLQEPWIRLVKIGEHIEEHPPSHRLGTIWTGSWIRENFDIWIGSGEENTAWRRLAETREVLRSVETQRLAPPDVLARMRERIYAAESSDWFWWYGDDFSSECAEEFDRLFRANLSEVHRLAGHEVPAALDVPIKRMKEIRLESPPRAFIRPVIDGRVTGYYEWLDAGRFNARSSQSSMYQAERILKDVYFGFDREHLFLRVDAAAGDMLKSLRGTRLEFHFVEPRVCRLTIPIEEGARSMTIQPAGAPPTAPGAPARTVIGAVLEAVIPFADLGMKPGEDVRFHLRVWRGDSDLERCPRHGHIRFQVPDRNFESRNWLV